MRVLVTGGAGFVGSNLSKRLLDEAHQITVFDNLSLGSLENLRDCTGRGGFDFVRGDLLDLACLQEVVRGHDLVFHMAANSDIPAGAKWTDTDLRQGTLATYNVLEAMRLEAVHDIVFASSSVIYGEPTVSPTPEDYGPLLPISMYGASKLACEGLISAFCHNYDFRAWMFRFGNICGLHATHGALVDFTRKLQANPRQLQILGNGRQAKPYLHVSECVDGMIYGWQHSHDQLNYFNLACEGATTATQLAEYVVDALRLQGVEFAYTGGERGWRGDVPQVRLDCNKMERLGWRAQMTSQEAARRAAREVTEELVCK